MLHQCELVLCASKVLKEEDFLQNFSSHFQNSSLSFLPFQILLPFHHAIHTQILPFHLFSQGSSTCTAAQM